MIEQMMMPGWMWGGKFKWQLRDEYGNIEREGEAPNMLHRLGQQQVLQAYFAPLGTLETVIASNATYTTATKTVVMTGAFTAALIAAGEEVYIVGGDAAADITAGIYDVATRADNNTITLSTSASAGNIAKGVVVMKKRRLFLALDNRSALSVNDTAAGLASYEEGGTDYARQSLDPDLSTNWTIAYDSDEDAYVATSAVCTFGPAGALGTAWQANRNMALVSHAGTIGNETSEVLIGSMSLGGAVSVAVGKSITVRYSVPIRGTKT